MIESEILEHTKILSIEQRIRIIEAIWCTINSDMRSTVSPPISLEQSPLHGKEIPYEDPTPTSSPDANYLQRPAFGFMKNTGKILGDVVESILPETAWDVLQ